MKEEFPDLCPLKPQALVPYPSLTGMLFSSRLQTLELEDAIGDSLAAGALQPLRDVYRHWSCDWTRVTWVSQDLRHDA